MKYKIIFILFLLLQLFFISTTSVVDAKSTFDEKNKVFIIKSPKEDKVLLTIQQISVKPDLVTMEEIFKITAYENYTFKKNKDFNIRWKKHKGKTDITGSKWEILEEVERIVTVPDYIDVEKNKTISNILTYANITDTYDDKLWRLDWGERHANEKWSIKSSDGDSAIGFDRYEVISTDPLNIKFFWNVTERVGSHQEAKYRDEWRPFSPDGRTINKNQSYNIKLTLYKQAETGDFSIKTIPIFAGIEEERFTWWNGSWNYYTDNPIPNGARPYQLSLNLSNSAGINNATHVFLNGHASNNFADIRFTLDNTTALSYWIEDNSTGRVWVNDTANGTVNMYYGNPSAVDSRDGNSTFEFFDDFTDNKFGRNPVISPSQAWESGTGDKNRWGSIALVNGKYYIYFTNNTNAFAAIGRATSTDLITWTKYANNPIIKNAVGPSLLKDLDGVTLIQYNGKYWMATMASNGSRVQIRSAANIDSDTWVIENSAALVPQAGTWYSSMVFTNSFIKEGSTYYLVFQGYDNIDWRIGYATASAPGGPYVVQGILLQSTMPWEGNAVLDPEVRKFGDTYYLFYTGGLYPVPYNNSYATSTSLTGSYTKSQIQLTPLQHTYPAILAKDSFYYILDDDQTTTGKGLYKRANLNGAFGSPFMWDSGGSPTVSGTELLLNADREYIKSGQTFLYKAMKIKAKFAPLSADNTYQYMGFSASSIGSDYNSATFVTTDTDMVAHSGNPTNSEDTSIYNTDYFGSYHDYEILWRKDEAKFIIDDALKATQTSYIPNTPLPVGIYDYRTAADFYVDWVFVRNYVSPGPAWAPWTREQQTSSQTSNPPAITSWGNSKTNNRSLTLTINTSEVITFNATANQSITAWTWLKDGIDQNNNFNSFTTSWSTPGTKTVKVTATNVNGTSNAVMWTVTVNAGVGVPAITDFAPSSPVSDTTGATRTFNVTISQTANITWYINNTEVQFDESATESSYTNTSAAQGTWNVTALIHNANGDAMQTWTWIVSGAAAAPVIFFTYPTPSNGTTLTQNYAYINTTILDSYDTTAFIDWNHSLAGWWRLNSENGENPLFFKDWSNRGNDGTCSGTNCPVSAPGKFGDALGFDGSDDYVTVPNSASLNPSHITVEAWFNASSGTLATQKSLIQKPYTSHTNPYYQYMLSLMDSGTYPKHADFYITVNGALYQVGDKNLNYSYGQWHYLAGTYNGSSITLYLDGIPVATRAVSGTLSSYNTVLQFGAYPNIGKTSTYVFNGKIDEVRIHSRALSPEEIKASYSSGTYWLYGNFINLAEGVYSYRAYAQNLLGSVNQTETRVLTLTTAPD